MSIFRKPLALVIYAVMILQTIGIFGQTQTSKPATETKKPEDKQATQPKKKPLSPAEKRSYDLLVATLDQSDQIADPADRSEIVGSAAIAIWKYDRERAKTFLRKTVDSLFDAYESHDD